MRRLTAALGLLLCTALGAAAPALAGTGSIAGTVTSAAGGEAIDGAWVCASGHPFPPGGCDNADSEGRYRIEGLDPGGYTVSFEADSQNYVAQKRGVGVLPDQEVTGVDAALEVGGRIAGRVTDVESGDPIERIEVCAPQIDSDEEIRTIYCDRTDFEGKYTIQALATGLYEVEFGPTPASPNPPNYIRQYYPGKPSRAEAGALQVTGGTIVGGIDAALQKGIEISGTVTDTAATPVVWQSRVCALDASSEAIVQCAPPEAAGQYWLAGLPFGSYRISFGVDVEEEPGLVLHPDGFVPQYYDGKPSFAAADVLGSGGPATFSGIDARLVRGDDPVKPRPFPIISLPPRNSILPLTRKPSPRCKKGFRRKRVAGRARCLKVHKRKHHREPATRTHAKGR